MQNISPGSLISINSLAPYTTPPFDFTMYNIVNSEQSNYLVNIDRAMDTVSPPQGYILRKRFRMNMDYGFKEDQFQGIN